MLGFKDKFHVKLNISATEFAEKLLTHVDTEFNNLSDFLLISKSSST